MEKQNMKLIAALLGGAAVGATLAVLFAPAKGSELRNKIVDEADGIKDMMESKLNEFSGVLRSVNKIYNDVKAKI